MRCRSASTSLTAVALALVGTGCRTGASDAALQSDLAPAAPTPTLHALENPQHGITPMTIEREVQMIRGLSDSILAKITTFRDAHPKAHGCVDGATLTVDEGLREKEELRKGVFAEPGRKYKAIVRFSSGSSDPKADDRAPGPQGMAVKILLDESQQAKVEDIPGETFVVGREFYKTFDIIAINGIEEFVVNDLPTYPAFFEASALVGAAAKEAAAAGKTPAEIGKIVGQIYGEKYVNKVPAQVRPAIAQNLGKLGALRAKNVLAERYNSWVPYAFDESRAVKYSFVPCAGQGASANPSSANFLGEQLAPDLKKGACFDVMAHLHEAGMPSVENAALPWGDAQTRRYVKLGKLELTQSLTTMDFCQALSYNPAHALPNQRGIGAVQRSRRIIYAEISAKRAGRR